MKKFILASVALLAVFASCKKEDIRTVYETTPATVTINFSVYDAFTGKDAVSPAVTTSAGTVDGSKIVIKGNKAVAAQEVTIKATVTDGLTANPRTGEQKVAISFLCEGGQATYSAKVVVGSPKAEITGFTCEEKKGAKQTKLAGILEKANHSYNDTLWVINNSEFVLYGTTTYTQKLGSKDPDVNKSGAKTSEELDYVLSMVSEKSIVDPEDGKDKTYDYTVSAFSRFNVFVTYEWVPMEYTCYRNFKTEDGNTAKEVIGVFKFNNYTTSVVYKEGFAPDHASHYVAGHGVDDAHYSHGHGHGGENAGGGIIAAE